MNVQFDIAGFRAQLRGKAEKIKAATRPAAQAGAQVIYDAARANAPLSEHAHFFYGSRWKKTKKTSGRYGQDGNMGATPFRPGNLRDSIYQVYSKDQSSPTRAVYHISWNTQIGKQIKFAPYGWMVELGTSHSPAFPFLGNAIHDNRERAAQTMRDTFAKYVTSS